MSTVAELKTEIEKTAKAFWAGTVAVREAYYTKAAASFLSETDARGVMATGQFNVTAADGTILKISPKSPQRKNDGIRGAQMNFWMYVGGALHIKYNLHVDVMTLEKEYEKAIAAEEEVSGWEPSQRERARLAGIKAIETREQKNWAVFAVKK